MVTPKSGIAQQVDVSAIAHTYGVRTINGQAEDLRAGAARPAGPGPGHQHRQRAAEDLDQRRTGCSP